MSNEIKLNVSQSRGYESVNLKVKGTQEFLGKEIPVIYGGFGEGQKVVLAKTIAEIHGVNVGDVNRRINDNRSRFRNNIDVIDLKVGYASDALLNLGFNQSQINASKNIYLLSERGYAKLIKIMDSDLAWEIHDQLMDEYFSMREERVNPYANLSPELQSILMLDQKQQMLEKNQTKLNQRVTELEENVKLEPGEYGLVSKRVSKRVYEVQKERQMNLNKKQIGELFRALNKDILEITGVKTRTQLRQKHLDMVLDFIDDWYPSKATMFNINQMSLDI